MLFSIRSLKHAKQKEILDQGPSFPYVATGSLAVNDAYEASGFSSSNYITLGNMPDFNADFRLQLVFSHNIELSPTSSHEIWYTPLLMPTSTTASRKNKGLSVSIKGCRSKSGVEIVMGTGTDHAGILESASYSVTKLDTSSLNTKYVLDIKRTMDSDSSATFTANIYDVNGKLLSSAAASDSIIAQKVNLTGYCLGCCGPITKRTYYDGGTIYLKECYFKAL